MILRHMGGRLVVLLVVVLALFVGSVDAVSVPGARAPALQRAGKKLPIGQPASGYDCKPFGVCEPCPEDELKQPYCQPFGNRRLLHCRPAGQTSKGEVPAWEACGKVVKKEQRDFYEFVTANVLFLMVCLSIYAVRTSALATQQYRQLAARIGIPSGSWRV